ncbi:hypothetical protein BIY23_00685 [Wolbachia pipientis]|uniref:Uncharacterized protein n=1 Tax=Wolbachia pipientis TaxID=955 RepID=A0A1E7QKJ4_WOLPI|nr:hypothetical protein [Wolbachia pipientis]OEY87000.1 hypothetical protein BIY23_00685 [Wolbachia pipientis]
MTSKTAEENLGLEKASVKTQEEDLAFWSMFAKVVEQTPGGFINALVTELKQVLKLDKTSIEVQKKNDIPTRYVISALKVFLETAKQNPDLIKESTNIQERYPGFPNISDEAWVKILTQDLDNKNMICEMLLQNPKVAKMFLERQSQERFVKNITANLEKNRSLETNLETQEKREIEYINVMAIREAFVKVLKQNLTFSKMSDINLSEIANENLSDLLLDIDEACPEFPNISDKVWINIFGSNLKHRETIYEMLLENSKPENMFLEIEILDLEIAKRFIIKMFLKTKELYPELAEMYSKKVTGNLKFMKTYLETVLIPELEKTYFKTVPKLVESFKIMSMQDIEEKEGETILVMEEIHPDVMVLRKAFIEMVKQNPKLINQYRQKKYSEFLKHYISDKSWVKILIQYPEYPNISDETWVEILTQNSKYRYMIYEMLIENLAAEIFLEIEILDLEIAKGFIKEMCYKTLKQYPKFAEIYFKRAVENSELVQTYLETVLRPEFEKTYFKTALKNSELVKKFCIMSTRDGTSKVGKIFAKIQAYPEVMKIRDLKVVKSFLEAVLKNSVLMRIFSEMQEQYPNLKKIFPEMQKKDSEIDELFFKVQVKYLQLEGTLPGPELGGTLSVEETSPNPASLKR